MMKKTFATASCLAAAFFSQAVFAECSTCVPVLCVPGLNQTANSLRPLVAHLKSQGFKHVQAVAYTPTDGSASIVEIARQVSEAAQALREQTGHQTIDIVGFSMGAIASRYVIQNMGGDQYVQKFVSISAPHYGTYSGYVLAMFKGVREMLPGSEFLEALNQDISALSQIDTYVLMTPHDLIVLPTHSAQLHGAKTRSFNVAIHHLMLKDPDVLAAVGDALKENRGPIYAWRFERDFSHHRKPNLYAWASVLKSTQPGKRMVGPWH